MKKKNIKPLVLSSLAALSLGSMSVAGTFALFTDQAETTINIGAAEVNVKNAMTIVDAYSLNQLDANTHTTKEAHYVNGGEVEVTDNTAGETTQIDVVNWTPGDGVKLRTAPTNSSNVTIKVRLKAVMSGDLAPALVMEVRNAEATGDALYAAKGSRTLVSDWVSVDPGENPAAFDLDIKFPNHGFEITAREEGIDNQYQGKPATIKISYEAVQGNADVSSSLLEKINTKLANKEIVDGSKNVNMYEAVNDLAGVATVAQIKANNYVWGADEDLFYEAAGVTTKQYKYFKVYDATNVPAKADQTFSIYADGSGWTSLELKGVGFDAGSVEGMTAVSYEGAASARENIIRTNGGTLTINASQDVIHHYGDTNYINIIAVAGNSYHENGNVGIVEISNGRLVLEKESDVARIHLSKSTIATEEVFNDITIAKDSSVEMPVFSRDPIEIPDEGKLVVALQDGTKADEDKDYVWLTAIGVYEQVVVSDQKESLAAEDAKNSYAAETGSNEQKDAAQQIANNISVQIGEEKYEVKAERNLQGEWEYKLEGETQEKTEAVAEYEVTVTEDVQEQPVVEVVNGATPVETTTTVENGVTAEKIAKDIEDTSNGVARIGSTRYGSLQDAFDASKNGDTIIVLKDIDLGVKSKTPLNTKANVTFTLDLNGHVVSASVNGTGVRVLVNNGLMALIDSSSAKTGAISNSAVTGNDCTRTVGNAVGASLTVTGAKILSHIGQAIINEGDSLVLNSGAIVKTTGAYSGDYSNGAAALDTRAGTTIINDGASLYSEEGLAIFAYYSPEVIINAGDIHCCVPKGLFYKDNNATITVKGGTFNSDPEMFVPTGYGVSFNNGVYTAGQSVIQYANVNTIEELKAAASAASSLNPLNVTLKGNVVIEDTVNLSKYVTLTIDSGVYVTVDNGGVLIHENTIVNNGFIHVQEGGFLSNPLSITGNDMLNDAPEGEYDEDLDMTVYEIENAMDLQWLSVIYYNVGDFYPEFYVTLKNDIVIPEGVNFQSIPYFCGVFDGNDHTISGIVMNSVESFTGIFTALGYATIKDLTINEAISVAAGTVGGVAGYCNGDTFFENVTVSGSINVSGSSYGTAGYVGNVYGMSSEEIIHFVNCENKANIYAPNASIVGGFYGTATGNMSPMYFVNCINSGNITSGGYAGSAGGFTSYQATGKSYVYGHQNTGTLMSGSTVVTHVFGCNDGFGEEYNSLMYDCVAGENGAYVITPKAA